jgi:hypothetical protein
MAARLQGRHSTRQTVGMAEPPPSGPVILSLPSHSGHVGCMSEVLRTSRMHRTSS